MAKAVIKVRRAGMGRVTIRKVKFRSWLDEQPRKKLTFSKKIPSKDEKGWSTEDFILEARQRGIDARFSTVNKWCIGAQPRLIPMSQLERAFPGIEF